MRTLFYTLPNGTTTTSYAEAKALGADKNFHLEEIFHPIVDEELKQKRLEHFRKVRENKA